MVWQELRQNPSCRSSLTVFLSPSWYKANIWHPDNHFFVHCFYRDTAKDPAYWSKICLYNMAKLAKEATTVRRVLEPFFHNFDAENHWSPEKGVASCILLYLQSLLAESGSLVTFNVITFSYICSFYLIFYINDYHFLNTRR